MNDQLKSALQTVFLKHYREWCLLSYSFLQDMHEAEDTVQDVFVCLLLKNEPGPIHNLKAYIGTTIRNSSLKRLRRTRRTVRLDHFKEGHSLSHEDQLICRENQLYIKKAIKALPQQGRKVFELCIMEGYRYEKTADTMGISINTVKYHLKKTFKALRHTLQNSY